MRHCCCPTAPRNPCSTTPPPPPPTSCCACTASVLIVVVVVVVMSHPFSCGQETRVIPRILQLRSHWLKSEKESLRLQEAGITKEVMNSAIAQFCLEIIAKHGEPAPRLCNKDPLTLKMGSYVIELFPNVSSCSNHMHAHSHALTHMHIYYVFPWDLQAKFLFMVRDGRATVHSIISRKVTITGFDLASYRQCMQKWNHAIELMHEQCRDIGKQRCMMVSLPQHEA